MKIDLSGQSFRSAGASTPVATALDAALLANGAIPAPYGHATKLLILAFPLDPDADFEAEPVLRLAEITAERMAQEGGGRILFLLSAMAGLPMRRHGAHSVMMAGALAAARGIAMRFGPSVLCNAVGIGALGDPVISGDAAMIGHTALGRAGTIEDAVDAALFLCDPLNSYTTGQILNVDGGWSAGYGRNF